MAQSASITAIDADGHILEHQSDVARYLEEPWNKRQTQLWPFDQPWDLAPSDKTGANNQYMPTLGYDRDLTAAQQVETWLRALDDNNIEQAVLYPTGSGSVTKLQERDFMIAVARACNSHFAADYSHERLKPLGVLPMHDPKAAAAEIGRCANELGLIGFEVLTSGLPFALGDPFYDPIYQAAEKYGVAIGIHGTRSGAYEFGANRLRSFSEVHAYSFTAGMLLHFTSVIANGLPLRFPNLRLGFLEIGATWLPYYLDRLDEHWEKRGHIDMPLLTSKPSEVFRKSNIYVSIEGKESLLAETIDFVGAEHLLYATDIPHWDSEFPDNLNDLREADNISDTDKEKLLYSNAKAFYAL